MAWAVAKYTEPLAAVNRAWEERSAVTRYEPSASCAVAYFACGCFWGVQHLFSRLDGVRATYVGYTGGRTPHPTYLQVRSHLTDHAEAVAVEYDPAATDYRALCRFFFEIHDPAQTDGQGEDIGEQYRSIIFYADAEQQAIAQEVADDLRRRGHEVNTLLRPATDFWVAEALHQDYYDHTGGAPYCHRRQVKF
ncbi:MAG: peptide-methionine (S)-S-oxide reductase MsrA [Bacteroidaceae bacterium]|nr:peptide-methionine (S)-S-oxide reductase MsrA [Bacteroidaceae bacterium]